MENDDRPKMTDPAEFAIIRKMYVQPRTILNADIDQEELNDRIASRHKKNEAR